MNSRLKLGLFCLFYMLWRFKFLRNERLEIRRSKVQNETTLKALVGFLTSDTYRVGYIDSPLVRWGGSFRGSVSTILHFLARKTTSRVRIEYDQELLVLKDGGTIGLDWVGKRPEKNDLKVPTVFMHHGLCGDSESLYIKHAIPPLLERGYRVVVMIARGCGNIPLSTSQGFTASNTSDMREAVQYVQQFSGPMYGVGFSLGAVLLLKYLGEEGDKTPLKGAVAISPSFDFSKTPPHFDLWSRKRLVKGLIEWAKKHESQLSDHPKINWSDLINAPNVRAFDTAGVVGPYGYDDVDHYYRDSSPCYKSAGITTPTLSVSALDDPVCCGTTIPPHEHETMGPGLVTCVTDAGGHVAFPVGFWPANSWMDQVIVDWLQSCSQSQN